MRFEVLTLFPTMITGYASESILGKAQEKSDVGIGVLDARGYAGRCLTPHRLPPRRPGRRDAFHSSTTIA